MFRQGTAFVARSPCICVLRDGASLFEIGETFCQKGATLQRQNGRCRSFMGTPPSKLRAGAQPSFQSDTVSTQSPGVWLGFQHFASWRSALRIRPSGRPVVAERPGAARLVVGIRLRARPAVLLEVATIQSITVRSILKILYETQSLKRY